MDDAIEIPRSGQRFRRAQQHGRMSVMAAGVHHARVLRPVGLIARLLDPERVHIRPERDGAVPLPRPHGRHDAGAADALGDLFDAERPQLLGHEGRCLSFLEAELGMLMQMPAPADHLGMQI